MGREKNFLNRLQKHSPQKRKNNKVDVIKIKNFYSLKDITKGVKMQPRARRKYSQHLSPKNSYPESSQKSLRKRQLESLKL